MTGTRREADRQEAMQAPAAERFEAIYAAHHGRIFGLAYRMMGNADDACDVTQDTFISAYQHLHKFEAVDAGSPADGAHLTAWLYRIAANKCIDALRKRKRRATFDWDAYARTAQASADHPETYALNSERAERIQRVLDAMTPRYRLVLLLHEHHGLSVREVAAAIGRSESAVKSMLFRARDQFRSLYELEGALARAA
jgi:RNA polymerase sigma-70 factor (ECF subfamily)